MPSVVEIIVGPFLGIVAVGLAYLLGIYLSLKCCRPSSEDDETLTSDGARPRREVLDPGGPPGHGIFIVSRSEDFLVRIPRLAAAPSRRNNPGRDFIPSPGPAPDYEPPPTYEDCVKNGLVLNV